MLIDFFFTLRQAKLPVSVKEYLTLLEGLKQQVIAPSLDEFYFLARMTLVKDEKHFDKFDQAFGAYFKGVEGAVDWRADIPLDWLIKKLERELSPEESQDRGHGRPRQADGAAQGAAERTARAARRRQ